MGRTMAYELARPGGFPCRLLRYGGTYRAVTAELTEFLGASLPEREASAGAKPTWRLPSVVGLASCRYRLAPENADTDGSEPGVPTSGRPQEKEPCSDIQEQGSGIHTLCGRTWT